MNKVNTIKGWVCVVWVIAISVMVFAVTHEEEDVPSQVQDRVQQRQQTMQSETMKDSAKQHTDKTREYHKGDKMQPCNIAGRSGYLQSADEVLGQNVYDRQGQKLGSIEELILSDSRQSIEYVIISADTKLYPVPLQALESGMEAYTLDISSSSLKQAPAISSLSSSQFKDAALRDKSHAYYKQQITAAQEKNMGQRMMDWAQQQTAELFSDEPAGMMYSANQIIGFEVQNSQGEDVGELKDIVYDVREGNLAYGLVSFGGLMGFGTKTAAVPWESLQLESTRQIAQLEGDSSSLRDAVVPDGDIQHLSEPTFARQVHQNFNQEPYWEVFGFVAPTGAQERSMTAWQAGSAFNKNFNPDAVQTMQGTIRRVGSFTPDKNAAEGLELKVKTSDERTLTVYAGPHDHYMQQSLRLNKGDQVMITGSRTTIDNKNVIMATRIQKGDSVLDLRDSEGKPAWSTDAMRDQRPQQSDDAIRMKKDTPPRYY